MPERFAVLVTILLSRLEDFDMPPDITKITDELSVMIADKVEAIKRREAYSASLADKHAP